MTVEVITANTSKAQQVYLDYGNTFSGQVMSFDQLTSEEYTPKYLDYLYMNDYNRGWNTMILTKNFDIEAGKKYYKIIDPGGKPIQVNGNEYVVYLFDLGRIQDNIQDKFVVVPTRTVFTQMAWHQYSRYYRDLYFDEVEYRNSKVQKLFLESRIRSIPALTIENHIRYERNRQIEGTMYDNKFQPADSVTMLAMVNKFVYTRQWGNWTFSPGV